MSRKTTPPPPKPAPPSANAVALIMDIDALYDRIEDVQRTLSDDDVKALLTPLHSLWNLPGRELHRRLREAQSAAILQEA